MQNRVPNQCYDSPLVIPYLLKWYTIKDVAGTKGVT